jgi:hypothetical protein
MKKTIEVAGVYSIEMDECQSLIFIVARIGKRELRKVEKVEN